MREGIILGIDTSNYTTSVALVDTDGNLLANIKRPLPVKDGECGLRQSDAVFAHIKNLPSAMDEAGKILDGRTPVAIGVSAKPRNQDGSYMPCFLSGVAAATTAANSIGIPLYRFSHQCGHIMAALHSSGRLDLCDGRDFCAFHVSGGTTETVRAHLEADGFHAELVGGSRDLHAGQLIDRVGVMMGLDFPAGPALEKLALSYKGKVAKRKPSVDGCYANLSGVQNIAEKLWKETNDKEAVAAFVLTHIAQTLAAITENYTVAFGKMPTVYAGGVMSCSVIKKILCERFECAFAEPALSADNAVGTAFLAKNAYISQN